MKYTIISFNKSFGIVFLNLIHNLVTKFKYYQGECLHEKFVYF